MGFGGVRGKNIFVFPDHEAGPLGWPAAEPHNALGPSYVCLNSFRQAFQFPVESPQTRGPLLEVGMRGKQGGHAAGQLCLS